MSLGSGRAAAAIVVLVLTLVACGDSGGDTTTTAPTVAETTSPPASAAPTTAAPTSTTTTTTSTSTTSTTTSTTSTTTTTTTTMASTTSAVPAVLLGEAEDFTEVLIDPAALAPLFNALNDANPSDPFYQVHTQQDDVYVGVELYTMFGAEWTGELGTFPADCTTHGICVYLDPDGTGPLEGMGPGEGVVEVIEVGDTTIVRIVDVIFTNSVGELFTLTDLTLGG